MPFYNGFSDYPQSKSKPASYYYRSWPKLITGILLLVLVPLSVLGLLTFSTLGIVGLKALGIAVIIAGVIIASIWVGIKILVDEGIL